MASSAPPTPLICFNCSGSGHVSKSVRPLNLVKLLVLLLLPSNHVQPPPSHPQPWLLDSGTTHHLTSDLDNLAIHSEYHGPEGVQIGNGSQLPISHMGTSSLVTTGQQYLLNDILHVPSAQQNLLSITSFTRSNQVSIEFFPGFFVIKDLATKQILHKGQSKDGLYSLLGTVPLSSSVQANATSFSLWHAYLGHASAQTIRTALGPIFHFSNKPSPSLCSACAVSKSHKLPFPSSTMRLMAL